MDLRHEPANMASMMTSMTMAMSSATATPSSMSSSMDMSTMMMGSPQMQMYFFSSQSTVLWSMSWAPSSTAAYAFTCIFLILLTIIFRALFAIKSSIAARQHARLLNQRIIVVAGRPESTDAVLAGEKNSTEAVVTRDARDEQVKVVQQRLIQKVQPWRWSVDFPRAVLFTVIVGIGYLLMLAVMTLNVGYFASILGGAFLGDLLLGRYVGSGEIGAH